MELTKEEIKKIAALSALPLSEEESEKYSKELTDIIDYNMSLLNKVNTDGVDTTAHVTGEVAWLRSDETQPSLSQEEALQNAPDKQSGFFKVPQILEG